MPSEDQDRKARSATTREIVEDFREWSGKVLQKVKEEADSLSAKGRLKLELASLKSKRGVELRKLGMKAFHLAEEGRVELPGAEENISRVRELTGEIKDREEKLASPGPPPSQEGDGGSSEASRDEEDQEAGL